MSWSRAVAAFFLPILAFYIFISDTCIAAAQAQTLPSLRQGTLEIDGVWARATPPAAKTGAVYLTVTNHGSVPERLVAAKSPAAAQAELHAHLNDGGVMRMKAVDTVVIGPGERVSLRPGNLHVMLVDLKSPLREGARLALTLSFAGAGEVTVEVPVLRNPPVSQDHRH